MLGCLPISSFNFEFAYMELLKILLPADAEFSAGNTRLLDNFCVPADWCDLYLRTRPRPELMPSEYQKEDESKTHGSEIIF